MIDLLRMRLRKKWGFDKNDEIGVNVALKSMRISWIFGMIFLFAWLLYEGYNAGINNISPNMVPGILLGLQIVIFGVASYLMEIEDRISKAIRISWMFGIIFLSVWLLHNFYNVFVNDVPANTFLLTLFLLQIVIFELSHTILENKMKEINEEDPQEITLRAVMSAWIFSIIFLLGWSAYEIYNAYMYNELVKAFPFILLLLQMATFRLLHFILKNRVYKAIQISWMFGIIFLFVYPFYDVYIDSTILNIFLCLQIVIFGISYLILENKMKKGTDEERPLIRRVGSIILKIIVTLIVINFIAMFLMSI